MQIQQGSTAEITPLPEVFHEFYDPNSYFQGDETALLGWLYERRHDKPVVVQSAKGERSLTVREQLAIELGHLALLRVDTISDWTGLGLREDELRGVLKIAEYRAEQDVSDVIQIIAAIKSQYPKIAKKAQKVDRHDLLLAGSVVAALSHGREKRLNGELVYDHARRVPSIIGIAARRPKKKLSEADILELRIVQYIGFCHDTFEDMLSSKLAERGASFLKNLFTPSPLMHKRLIEALGVDATNGEQSGLEAAMSMLALTRFVGIDGRMASRRNTEIVVTDTYATVVKPADTTDNLVVDPKIVNNEAAKQELLSKHLDYEHGLERYAATNRMPGPKFLRRTGRNIASIRQKIVDDLLTFSYSNRLIALLESEIVIEACNRYMQRQAAA